MSSLELTAGAPDANSTAGRPDPYASPTSLPYRFRERRFPHVARLIDSVIARNGRCRILDIGGTERYWDIAGATLADRDVRIDLVNIEPMTVRSSRFRALTGDATDLSQLPDMSYDIVHSNSVIEHVGNWAQMAAMAHNVRRLAPSYFVQTPNYWFPLEPHFRTPFFHFLPEQLRYRLIMQTSLGFRGRAASLDEAMRTIQGACLIDRRQMAELFPDARIERERFCLMTKSLMAIRDRA
jgi:hypothetical protein